MSKNTATKNKNNNVNNNNKSRNLFTRLKIRLIDSSLLLLNLNSLANNGRVGEAGRGIIHRSYGGKIDETTKKLMSSLKIFSNF